MISFDTDYYSYYYYYCCYYCYCYYYYETFTGGQCEGLNDPRRSRGLNTALVIWLGPVVALR